MHIFLCPPVPSQSFTSPHPLQPHSIIIVSLETSLDENATVGAAKEAAVEIVNAPRRHKGDASDWGGFLCYMHSRIGPF
jgi:hypothetical protein